MPIHNPSHATACNDKSGFIGQFCRYRHLLVITLGFSAVLLLLVTVVVVGLTRMHSIKTRLDAIGSVTTQKMQLVMTIREGILKRQVVMRELVLSNDVFERDELQVKIHHYAAEVQQSLEAFDAMPLSQREKAGMAKLHASLRLAYPPQETLINKAIEMVDMDDLRSLLDEIFVLQSNLLPWLDDLMKAQQETMQQVFLAAEQSYQNARLLMILLGAVATLLGIIIAHYVLKVTRAQAATVSAAMKELSESHHLLEDRVEERTRDLAIARDEALEASKTKSQFLANMSHELRTPLNAIIGYSEMLAEDAEDDGHDGYIPDLEKIQSAGKHLLGLINNILDLSKIEAGKMQMSPETFEIEPLLKEVTDTVKPLFAKNNNRLVINCADDCGGMYADETGVRQMLFNLLSNATKFTKDGVVTLTMRRSREADQDWLTCAVSDTGIGLSAEQIGRLFEDFSQADASTTRQYGGTGLGLAITKRLCEMMEGDIQVTSELGQGATFTIRLPVKTAPSDNTSESETTEQPRVVVIDESTESDTRLLEVLTNAGYGYHKLSRNPDAITELRAAPPQVIILNLELPQTADLAFVDTLCSDPVLKVLPMIGIVTANLDATIRQRLKTQLGTLVSRESIVSETLGSALKRQLGDFLDSPDNADAVRRHA